MLEHAVKQLITSYMLSPVASLWFSSNLIVLPCRVEKCSRRDFVAVTKKFALEIQMQCLSFI